MRPDTLLQDPGTSTLQTFRGQAANLKIWVHENGERMHRSGSRAGPGDGSCHRGEARFKELRVEHSQTSCYSRPPFLGTPLSSLQKGVRTVEAEAGLGRETEAVGDFMCIYVCIYIYI